ncbi:heterokaryon incompatibility protein-domain-containing protein [Paraphoma chrysanthemicola]|nr:heterokaryon incompatibility protein-domain-containing protein [Paraphoma chrysanthemicola]
MWLLDTSTIELHDFIDSQVPPYTILSHTWEDEEVLHHELRESPLAVRHKKGFSKVVKFCEISKSRGYQWAWQDNCCIDKRSSAELSEAINSMFHYYREAEECLIYLSDVPSVADVGMRRQLQLTQMRDCRWFTRGWTLQELIAPQSRVLFDAHWSPIDDGEDLVDTLASITKIYPELLRNRDLLSTFCVAERMSWASQRQTTRAEDRAYSLMGLFNIHMPVLYGEGAQKAFRRLQEEIIRISFDQSIYVWQGSYKSSGLLAKSPSDFAETPRLGLWAPVSLAPSMMTNVGLSIRMNVTEVKSEDASWLKDDYRPEEMDYLAVVACDVWNGTSWVLLVLHLQQIPNAGFYVNGRRCKAFRRVHCNTYQKVFVDSVKGRFGSGSSTDILVLEDEHYELVGLALDDDSVRANGLSFS